MCNSKKLNSLVVKKYVKHGATDLYLCFIRGRQIIFHFHIGLFHDAYIHNVVLIYYPSQSIIQVDLMVHMLQGVHALSHLL